MQAVSVSDYTNRVYLNPEGAPVQLYVGYYASQRTGDTIHSPKNCLPGAGLGSDSFWLRHDLPSETGVRLSLTNM